MDVEIIGFPSRRRKTVIVIDYTEYREEVRSSLGGNQQVHNLLAAHETEQAHSLITAGSFNQRSVAAVKTEEQEMFSRGSYLQFPQQSRYPKPRANRDMVEIKCDVCNISIRGQDQYNSHLSGSKHGKKVTEQENMKKIEDNPSIKYDEYSGGYECTVCNVSLNSSSVAMFHVAGNKHQEKAKETNSRALDGPVKVEGSSTEPDSRTTNGNGLKDGKPEVKADPSEVVPLMSMDLPSEFGSSKKIKTESANSTPNRNPNERGNFNNMRQNNAPIRSQPYPAAPNFRPRMAPLASSFVSKYTKHAVEATIYTGLNAVRPWKPPGQSPAKPQTYPCLACNIVTNSEQQLQQHLSSEKHKNRLVSDGSATTKPIAPAPPTSALRCESCGVSVNSQIQLDQHLQSPKHRKQLGRYHPYRN